jgi:hypothetical protein
MSHPYNPYFTFDGLCFQTPGDAIEITINTAAAMQVLEDVARNREPRSDPMLALALLEDTHPKLEADCDAFRIALSLKDAADERHRLKLAIRAYNALADRLSGRAKR